MVEQLVGSDAAMSSPCYKHAIVYSLDVETSATVTATGSAISQLDQPPRLPGEARRVCDGTLRSVRQ